MNAGAPLSARLGTAQDSWVGLSEGGGTHLPCACDRRHAVGEKANATYMSEHAPNLLVEPLGLIGGSHRSHDLEKASGLFKVLTFPQGHDAALLVRIPRL